MRHQTDLIRYLELMSGLEDELSPESIERARRDPHARRHPHPCSMTIHAGISCSYSCTYCYIYDMGFPPRARPYPLNGKGLLYALTLNPYVVLRPGGTMLAMGFVVDAVRNELAKHVPLFKPPDKDISIVFGPD